MDVDRWREVISIVNTDIVTFPRSTEVIRPLMTSYVIFRGFVPPGVIRCAYFEFGIVLKFTCVEMESLG